MRCFLEILTPDSFYPGRIDSIVNSNFPAVTRPNVEIYTDGGCEPNPGPGGYGAVLVHPRKRAEISGGFRSGRGSM